MAARRLPVSGRDRVVTGGTGGPHQGKVNFQTGPGGSKGGQHHPAAPQLDTANCPGARPIDAAPVRPGTRHPRRHPTAPRSRSPGPHRLAAADPARGGPPCASTLTSNTRRVIAKVEWHPGELYPRSASS